MRTTPQRGTGRRAADTPVPGAMDADIAFLLFWAALAFALAVAFVVTTPINRWLMGRGKGHAIVHAWH
ncbi:DUF4396 domain-containing protein [Modestobacter lapidis]